MAAAYPTLLDLPPDLLIRIGTQLPYAERLRLSLVCRRWRDACAGPSELWSSVDARIEVADAVADEMPEGQEAEHILEHLIREDAFNKLDAFRTWLAPRAVAVAHLSLQLQVRNRDVAEDLDIQLPARVLPPRHAVPCMPALRHLTLRFSGSAELAFTLCPALPALRTLWLVNMHLALKQAHLGSDFSCFPDGPSGLEFALYNVRLWFDLMIELGLAWLPPCTTKLRLLNAGLYRVPRVVAHLPRLRSLELTSNGGLDSSSLSRLTTLGALRQGLRQLDLGENALTRFPTEVSALTNLRILFLYRNFGQLVGVHVAPQDWEALRPLRKLVFLSISSNHLPVLPPAVLAMSHLRGLHIEDNPLVQRLAPHPCFANLLELLLDWKDALSAPEALLACTRLTRLTLHSHAAWSTTAPGSVEVPAALGDRLLDALAAMPSLRLVEDVIPPEADLLAAAVARCMWRLGRRCPGLQLEELNSTYIGWSLGKMPAEVEAEMAASDAAAAVEVVEEDSAAAGGGGGS